MPYGILVVEDGNGMYQIIGEVASPREAAELARNYQEVAEPENENACIPPTEYVIWRRNRDGAYVVRESLELLPGADWNLTDTHGALMIAHRA